MSSWTPQDVFYTVLDMVEGDLLDHLDYLQDEHPEKISNATRSEMYNLLVKKLREIEYGED